MIAAMATGAKGEQIVVLGLTRTNVKRLMAGEPIRVDAEHHPGFPEQLKVLVMFGETERALTEQLKPLISKETKVVGVPRQPGNA